MHERTDSEQAILDRVNEAAGPSRRSFVVGAAVAVAGVALADSGVAEAAAPAPNLAATPPANFTPMTAPGRVVRVTKADSLAANKLYPKPDDAKEMLRRALQELTGKPTMAEAARLFVHPEDKVCVKVNGIALQNMGTNKELVLPFIEAMIEAGVPPEHITVLEQYQGFLNGTRINAGNLPKGVKISIHANGDATMPERLIQGTGVRTKFVKAVTESSAIINFALIKDHSICGYTGAIKNLTHGCTINPQDFHAHNASPQIALLASQDIITSRIRLNISDGFKLMAEGGPLYKQPRYVIPHESVYVSTDMVALDAVGWEQVEQARANFKLKTLAAANREPKYIAKAAELGLGIADYARIQLQEVTI